MKEFWKGLRNSFFAGLVVVVPVAGSIVILLGLFNWVTNFLLPSSLRGQEEAFVYRVVALVAFVAVVTLVGWVTRLVAGRRMIALTESIIARVPLLNKIYGFVREVSHTMLTGQKTMFQRVVLVPHPRPGMFAVGFVTSERAEEARAKTNSDLLHVFVPASPPTHGFLLLVPREQVVDLDMSVAEGMKMVLSGGAVVPPHIPKAQPTVSPPAR
jgi:uncharacterized membrane protein